MSSNRLFNKLVDSPSMIKRGILLFLDFVLINLALLEAVLVRLDESWLTLLDQFWWLSLALPACSFPCLIRLGLYRAIIRYTSLDVLWTIFKAAVCSAVILIVLISLKGWNGFPRSVPFLYMVFSFLLLSGSRLLFRYIFNQVMANGSSQAQKVIIYGAGSSGAQISSAFKLSDEFITVAFVDDNPDLHGRELNGIKIHPPEKIPELLRLHLPDFILLAMPSAGRKRIKEILEDLENLPVQIKRLPYLEQLVSGNIDISDIQDIDIEDLLGRDPVPPRPDLLQACITGKAVMVTGAGGSIGSELCRQIARLRPARLILFELSEYALYKIETELKEEFKEDLNLVPILGSVRDYNRIKAVISAFDVDTIYHAAAYKHVPLVEYNPIEGIKNNLFGTLKAALAAQECGVEKFLLISTDKAVRPTNVMGASKRLAELVLQALASRETNKSHKTVFTMVRFGNVLGSSGSVVPLFRKQISGGGPVTVTHPEIIRYFMTIPEAVELVIQAGSMGRGGDVFVLDMGEPIKIVDLAKKMIALSGLTVRDENNPDGDIEIVFTGLRPGEKLYEELLVGNNVVGTDHPMIMRAQEDFKPWPHIKRQLDRLEQACNSFDLERIKRLMQDLVEDYQPQCDAVDPVWLANLSGRRHEEALKVFAHPSLG